MDWKLPIKIYTIGSIKCTSLGDSIEGNNKGLQKILKSKGLTWHEKREYRNLGFNQEKLAYLKAVQLERKSLLKEIHY